MVATRSRALTRVLLSSAAIAAPYWVHAQDRGGEVTQIETVIVTARKRTETIQEVPATIGVVSAEKLAASGATTLTQLPSVAPGLNMTASPNSNEFGVTVRGLGSAPGNTSFDSSVSLFVDGVYAPRNREFAASMFDIERIEVVRGTQAALLGKNTSLGAINIITKRPGARLGGDLRVAREFEVGATSVTGGVDLPLSDTFAVRVSGQYVDKDGAVDNRVNGRDAVRLKDKALRGVALWRPSEAFDLVAMAQHDQVDNRGTPAEFVASNGVPELLQALAGAPGTLDTRLDLQNGVTAPAIGGEQHGRLTSDRYSATARYGLGDYELTAVSGYSRMKNLSSDDYDFQAGDYLYGTTDERGRQFSQEVRLSSPVEDRFSYLIGALYLDGELDVRTTRVANYPFGPAPGVNVAGAYTQRFDQTTRAYSVFGNAIYKFSDRLQGQVGLRWTKEDKDVDLARTPTTPGLFSVVLYPAYAPFTSSRTERSFDYSVGLKYDLNANANLYASYGQGTKSGGFASSVTQLDKAAYLEEVARTAEAGVKLSAANGLWVFNAALFDTRVDDFQLVTFTGLQFEIGNTDLKSQGLEVETYWRPIRGLRLSLNTTYADATDEKTGTTPPLAPKWSGNAAAAYAHPVGQTLEARVEVSIDFRSKRYYQQDPATSPAGEAFTPVNLSLALASPNAGWELRLIGRNLLDERELSFAFPTPIVGAGAQNGIAEEPRTIGLQFSVKR